VLAFLKRRWILSLFALGCLGAMCVDVLYSTYSDSASLETYYGFVRGRITYFSAVGWNNAMLFHEESEFGDANGFALRREDLAKPGLHRPMPGSSFIMRPKNIIAAEVRIPLWLPLSAVLGWLVIRELRWREKRARKAEQA
jgi:hypothetical protein